MVHTFTSSGTFVVTTGGDVEYLVVAGGGGGMRHGGGGGCRSSTVTAPGSAGGSGIVIVRYVLPSPTLARSAIADPYATWSGGAAFATDSNNDGVANGLAWLLGAGNPSATATALLPKPTNEGGKLVLTFRCLKTANRGAAVLKVQFTNDLGQADLWASHEAVVPAADGIVGSVVFVTTPDADPAFINVRAEIPASAASPAGKLFGRLYSSDN